MQPISTGVRGLTLQTCGSAKEVSSYVKGIAMEPIPRLMTPRFGVLTRIAAGVFFITGLAALIAAVNGFVLGDRLILLFLAVTFMIVGAGIWIECRWAWWTGVGVTVATVLLARVLDVPADTGPAWPGLIVLFVITAIQGSRDRSRSSSS